MTANVGSQSTVLRTVNLDASQTYDNEGKVLTVKYPDTVSTGPTYTYAYDAMGRPISLTDNQSVTWVNNVQYGLSSELLQMSYGYYAGYTETRAYNSRLHLTPLGGMQYRYSPTQNNGQITQQYDGASGEEVTYTYDSLQRLIGAVTTDPSWGQSFTYDGFGNRTSATVTKGSAPSGNWSYDPTTNRMGGFSYDANGNMTSAPNVSGLLTYDVENRLVSVPASPSSEIYSYGPARLNQHGGQACCDSTQFSPAKLIQPYAVTGASCKTRGLPEAWSGEARKTRLKINV